MDSHPGLAGDTLAEDILGGVHNLVVGNPGVEGNLDVAVDSQGSHGRMEGLRVLRDDQACTYGVGPSAGQGNPGDPALLPSNYSCLGGIETAPPSLEKAVVKDVYEDRFILPGLGDGWGHGSR